MQDVRQAYVMPHEVAARPVPTRKHGCACSRKICVIIASTVTTLIVVAIALGVGLGIGLKKHHSDVACYCGGTGLYSTSDVGLDYLTVAQSSAGCRHACPDNNNCPDCCSADATSVCCPLPAACYPNCLAYSFADCPALSLYGS